MMISIGVSNRRHLPVWKMYEWTFAPWQIMKLLKTRARFRRFNLKKLDNGNYSMTIYGKEMELSRYFAVGVVNEFELWEEDYSKVMDLKGKTVLDVGSGDGETALIFLQAGANKVIGIEADPVAAKLSVENARRNNLNFEVLNEKFTLGHLRIPHDFMKVDIEGNEKILLNLANKDINPFVIETHGKELTDMIASKFGTETVRQSHEDTWILKKLEPAKKATRPAIIPNISNTGNSRRPSGN